MNKKSVDSRRSGMTGTSSHLASVYGKDFLEPVWENGHQILAAGDNNRTRNTPFCIGYSVNPSLKNEDDVIMRSSKRAKLSNISYKPNEEFPNLKDSNSHTQETNKPRMDSQKQYLGSSCDQRTRKVNFSNISIPTVFLKSTNASSTRVEKIELKATEVASTSNKEADDHNSAVIELTKRSHGLQEQTSFTANKSKPESLPNSEALTEKGKADETSFCNERSSSSVCCSLEASNNPNFSIRKHEDTDDDSAYFSDDDEETENLVRDSNRIKRNRNAETRSLTERKRRDKINEKIRTLKDLIPNCNKVDKASMLDDAIDYLKTLKFQLEIMSMGRGLCMPFMMLQHQMNAGAQNLMGFRPGNGIPYTSPPQFPIPPLSAGVTDNRLQMFGFSNQMIPPPMPIPNAPLFPMIIGNSSTQPFNATNIVNNSKT